MLHLNPGGRSAEFLTVREVRPAPWWLPEGATSVEVRLDGPARATHLRGEPVEVATAQGGAPVVLPLASSPVEENSSAGCAAWEGMQLREPVVTS